MSDVLRAILKIIVLCAIAVPLIIAHDRTEWFSIAWWLLLGIEVALCWAASVAAKHSKCRVGDETPHELGDIAERWLSRALSKIWRRLVKRGEQEAERDDRRG